MYMIAAILVTIFLMVLTMYAGSRLFRLFNRRQRRRQRRKHSISLIGTKIDKLTESVVSRGASDEVI